MQEIYDALNIENNVTIRNGARLRSCFDVSALAANAIGAVGAAITDLRKALHLPHEDRVIIDQRLASLWFGFSVKPVGWTLPPIWDAIAGDYLAKDGWIKLHTNLAHHRAAACRVLGVAPEREMVAKAIGRWNKDDLESAIIEDGGVSAAMRSLDDWRSHPQGAAVSAEPLIRWRHKPAQYRDYGARLERPLHGLRVLDLTRVLAGPVATRTLAGLGASILRIDPPDWEEDNVVPDITLGKDCARLDLRVVEGRETFLELLSDADILVHGFRPGALEALGLGADVRQLAAPNLIDISLDAYGWSGPWEGRRGFDSLVQMSSGIAHRGMTWANAEKPTPLPVQALDHATGYMMAAAAIKGLASLARGDGAASAQLSLARTAVLLVAYPQVTPGDLDLAPSTDDFNDAQEKTPWGPALRLKSPICSPNARLRWEKPACELGSAQPRWPQ